MEFHIRRRLSLDSRSDARLDAHRIAARGYYIAGHSCLVPRDSEPSLHRLDILLKETLHVKYNVGEYLRVADQAFQGNKFIGLMGRIA